MATQMINTPMPNNPTLSPCPNLKCNGDDIRLDEREFTELPEIKMYQRACIMCGVSASLEQSEEEANAAWNALPRSPEALSAGLRPCEYRRWASNANPPGLPPQWFSGYFHGWQDGPNVKEAIVETETGDVIDVQYNWLRFTDRPAAGTKEGK